MESKINYTIVGLFVTILLSSLIFFAYWLGKHGGDNKYDYYTVYISESVAGLSTDASVKYRGVNVGTVDHIRLNPKNSEQVELLLKIEQNTPVKEDTTAALKSFGLTGLSYIELAGGSQKSPLLKASTGNIAIIPSRLSTFARIDESMSQLTGKSSQALERFNQLLSEENLKNFSETLSETNLLVKDLRKQLTGINHFIAGGIEMEQQVITAFDMVKSASVSMKSMAEHLQINSTDLSRNMSHGVQQSLDTFNQLISELDIFVRYMLTTTQHFEANPSDLLFKKTQPKLGPGEGGRNEQ